MDTDALKEMHRHVQMQNVTDDFLTKLDLIEKYPELFSKNNQKHRVELTKDEIEVLRAMTVERDGK